MEIEGNITNLSTKKGNGKTGIIISHELKVTCAKLPPKDQAKLGELMEAGPVRITIERIQATFNDPGKNG